MTRTQIREFLKAGVDALDPVLEFGSGLITDFNAKPDKTHPQVWHEQRPIGGTNTPAGAPFDVWEIRLHIAVGHFQQDVSPTDYEDIIDVCDLVAQKLIAQYNFILYSTSTEIPVETRKLYRMVTISDRLRTPFTKKHAHVMSGVILSFKINAPDTTDVC